MGVMEKKALRVSLFYRFSCADQYFQGQEKYTGDNEVLQNASYNYLGFLSAYGLTNRLSVEAEAGYLPIDHDDSHAATVGGSFALLLHGVQPAGSEAAEAKKKLGKLGAYNRS